MCKCCARQGTGALRVHQACAAHRAKARMRRVDTLCFACGSAQRSAQGADRPRGHWRAPDS
eukprot:11619230-Alexandrium_andersonii.AAC.1